MSGGRPPSLDAPSDSPSQDEGTLQDAGQQRRAGEALRGSRAVARDALERVQGLLDAMPDLWFVLDGEGGVLEVSRPDHPSLPALWEPSCGRHLTQVFPAAVAQLAGAAFGRARAGAGPQQIQYRLTTAAGSERSFEARIVSMDDGRWLYLTRDITEALDAQKALRDSEARLARAMRGTSDGLWEWDVRSGQLYLSARWKALLGFAPHELADAEDSFFGRLHPDDLGLVRAAVQAHFRHGAPYDVELRLLDKGGDWRWFRSRGEAERDAQGQPLQMAGSISDITAERQIGEALRDSQARYSAMVQTAPVGILLSTLDEGTVVEVNEAMTRLLGWSADEMVGRDTVELGVWIDDAERAAFIGELQRLGHAERLHLQLRHRSGRRLHAQLASQRLALAGRQLVLSAVTDISDRMATEQALGEQRQAFAAIFDAASDAIVSVDAQGLVLLFNPGAERVFGQSAAAVQGRPIDLLLPVAQRAAHRGDLVAFAASASSRRAMGAGRVKGLRADGRELDLEASISKALVGGQMVLTAILRDVTEQVQAETDALRHRFELSALTRELLEQEKRTTQRLAQALHDQLGQTLTALRLSLDRERRVPVADAAEASRRQAQRAALVEQALTQVRQVLVDLRPPLLDEEGLAAALDNEVRTRQVLHADLDLLLEVPSAAQARRWPTEVEYALFMIAREALDNALRHANATLVRVALDSGADCLCLEVIDDGAGLLAGGERARPGHLGLIGMRERARAIGALLEIGPAPECGTRVCVTWKPPR